METTDIQKRIDKMPAKMSAKGLYFPSAEFVLEANGGCRVAIRYYKTLEDKSNYRGTCEWFRDGSIADQLDAADKFITALPSKDEVRFNEFMGALGSVIDLGKKNGIEVEFLNPLVAIMKTLSKNALADQRAA
jgi:hypothetical protein